MARDTPGRDAYLQRQRQGNQHVIRQAARNKTSKGLGLTQLPVNVTPQAASYLPSRRAMSLDPVDALRHE